MVILLSDDLEFSEFSNEDFIDGINLLARCAFEGKHYLVSEPRTARAIKERGQWEGRTRNVLNHLISTYSTRFGIVFEVDVLIVVSSHGTSVPRVEFSGLQRRIIVGGEFFSDSERIRKAVILCENLDDCDVYRVMARLYRNRAGFGSIEIALENDSGGGSATPQKLDDHALRYSFVLCVVDSDRAYMGRKLGDTAKRVLRFSNPEFYPTIHIEILGCRELENLLPDTYYSTRAADLRAQPATARVLELLSEAFPTYRLFYDIKEGVSLSLVFQLPRGSDESVAVNDALRAIIDREFGGVLERFPCIGSSACIELTKCRCRIVGGDRGSHVRDFVSTFGVRAQEGEGTVIVAPILAEWLKLGKMLFDWGCAQRIGTS